jgi:uncharacterized protein (TIGR03435 family)
MRVLPVIATLACGSMLGQGRFEVASIKPTPDPPVRTGMFPKPGLLNVGNYTLKRLIAEVYRVKTYQLVGGPAWIDTDHFDIVAKAPDGAKFGEMIQMLIPLMEDRFQLKLRRETREMPIYALTVAPKGVRMKPAAADEKKGFSINGTSVQGFKVSMRMLADILGGQLDRPVRDESGLAGEFAFMLKYAPDARPDDSPTADLGVSIFTAVQEQLGLKLEPRKGPVEIVVIDSAQRPSEN